MKAIYAGSFDPITLGHMEIFHKANNLFDEVIMVVAHHPTKKHLFPVEERVRLVKESTGAETRRLAEDETTAFMAKRMGVTHLVRGLRGHTDIDNEFVTARLNREIGDDLETVFFIPSINVEELSSTIVRSIHGLRGWVELLSSRVPKPVLRALKLADLERRLNNHSLWEKVLITEQKTYHNLEHSYDVAYDLIYDISKEDVTPIITAAVVHDLAKTPEESMTAAYYPPRSTMGWVARPLVHSLVLATDHATPDYPKEELLCKFASADLKTLASDRDDYYEYVARLRPEYDITDEEWVIGRTRFLQSMLKRKPLFPHPEYEKKYGEKARTNMWSELDMMKKQAYAELIKM